MMLKNVLIIAAIAVGFCLGGFFFGTHVKDQEWAREVEQAKRQEMATGVLGCVYAVDSNLLRFLHEPTATTLGKAVWREERCEEILDVVGSRTQNEELGLVFGEARLFLDGYKQVMLELMTKRFEVRDGELSEEEFQEVQAELLQETRKFIYTLEGLLLLGIQNVP